MPSLGGSRNVTKASLMPSWSEGLKYCTPSVKLRAAMMMVAVTSREPYEKFTCAQGSGTTLLYPKLSKSPGNDGRNVEHHLLLTSSDIGALVEADAQRRQQEAVEIEAPILGARRERPERRCHASRHRRRLRIAGVHAQRVAGLSRCLAVGRIGRASLLPGELGPCGSAGCILPRGARSHAGHRQERREPYVSSRS